MHTATAVLLDHVSPAHPSTAHCREEAFLSVGSMLRSYQDRCEAVMKRGEAGKKVRFDDGGVPAQGEGEGGVDEVDWVFATGDEVL